MTTQSYNGAVKITWWLVLALMTITESLGSHDQILGTLQLTVFTTIVVDCDHVITICYRWIWIFGQIFNKDGKLYLFIWFLQSQPPISTWLWTVYIIKHKNKLKAHKTLQNKYYVVMELIQPITVRGILES